MVGDLCTAPPVLPLGARTSLAQNLLRIHCTLGQKSVQAYSYASTGTHKNTNAYAHALMARAWKGKCGFHWFGNSLFLMMEKLAFC